MNDVMCPIPTPFEELVRYNREIKIIEFDLEQVRMVHNECLFVGTICPTVVCSGDMYGTLSLVVYRLQFAWRTVVHRWCVKKIDILLGGRSLGNKFYTRSAVYNYSGDYTFGARLLPGDAYDYGDPEHYGTGRCELLREFEAFLHEEGRSDLTLVELERLYRPQLNGLKRIHKLYLKEQEYWDYSHHH